MKNKFIFWTILTVSLITNFILLHSTIERAKEKYTAHEIAEKETVTVTQDEDWSTFIKALAWVESRWDDNAINSKQAVGYLQLTPILVKDVNRIIGTNNYTLENRNDRELSIEMFNIIMDNYNPQHDKHLAMKIWNPYAKLSYHRAVMNKYEELKSTP